MTEENSQDQDKNEPDARDIYYAARALFENARNALQALEGNKQEIIKTLADELEKLGYPLDMISEAISSNLEGYVSARYVRETLEEKYKNKKRIRNKVTNEGGKNTAIGDVIEVTADNNYEPVKISLTTNGKPANHDEEMKQIYHDPERNGVNKEQQPADTVLRWMDIAKDKDLRIGQLEEQLKQQREQIQELVKSVNAVTDAKQAKDKKPVSATETLEYKALFSQKAILEERIEELEQLVKKEMKTNPNIGFQTATDIVDREIANQNNENATNMQRVSNDITTITTTIPNEVEFPAELFGRFFIATRNVKKSLHLKINNGKVEGWKDEDG